MSSGALPRLMRRWVAVHEAGHAAISLALGQGHQEGVNITMTGRALGAHAVGDQVDLTGMPRLVVVRESIKRLLVSLAGPMALAMIGGPAFDLDTFRPGSAIEDPDSDEAKVQQALAHLDAHLGQQAARADELATTTSDLLRRADVQDLLQTISEALVRRGRIGGTGLALLHDHCPTDPHLIRIPTTMAERWLATGLTKVS